MKFLHYFTVPPAPHREPQPLCCDPVHCTVYKEEEEEDLLKETQWDPCLSLIYISSLLLKHDTTSDKCVKSVQIQRNTGFNSNHIGNKAAIFWLIFFKRLMCSRSRKRRMGVFGFEGIFWGIKTKLFSHFFVKTAKVALSRVTGFSLIQTRTMGQTLTCSVCLCESESQKTREADRLHLSGSFRSCSGWCVLHTQDSKMHPYFSSKEAELHPQLHVSSTPNIKIKIFHLGKKTKTIPRSGRAKS